MQTYANIALTFAKALVEENFEGASQLLCIELRRQLSPAELRQKLWGMYEGYAPHDRPLRAALDRALTSTNTDWPARQPNDLGWTYVSILGKDFVEGITVTVAQINGKPLIRHIEWGRP